MFVANLTPITLIGAASGLDHAQIAVLLQNAMFVAGIATLIQLYPIWKIGSRLPVVMGVSFTFVTILSYVGTTYGYPTVMGAVLIGGLIEGTLGLLAKYWRKIITPVVAASVVTAIGYSLFNVGTRSFGGGYTENFGSPQNLLLGTITLVACLLFNIFAKGYWKQLSVLAGLIIGYLVALAMGMVDLSGIFAGGYLALPRLLPYLPEFNIGAIASVTIIFMVSAAETIGDTTAVVSGGLGREIQTSEISGSLACDGYASAISSLFGCPPVTSFSQNVGLVNMTGVVNRFTLMTGAVCMMLAGGQLLCQPAGVGAGRMYFDDVWNHHGQRNPDDFQSRLLPEKRHHRGAVAGGGNRLYLRKRNGHLENLPAGHPGCLFGKLCSSGICNVHPAQRPAAKGYGNQTRRQCKIIRQKSSGTSKVPELFT